MAIGRSRGVVIAALLWCVGVAVVATAAEAARAGSAPRGSAADAQIDRLADELLEHMRKTSVSARLESNLAVVRLDDLSLAAAQREGAFCRGLLARSEQLALKPVSHERWLLARVLRNALATCAHAQDDYWLKFAVTPYTGGFYLVGLRGLFAFHLLDTPAARENYWQLVDQYAVLLNQVAAKTRAQAARGIRVPKPAIEGVRATFERLKSGAAQTFAVPAERLAGANAEERAAFDSTINDLVTRRIVPAYEHILAIFDESYVAQAPEAVGISQYPGGRDSYLRRIRFGTGSPLTPQQIHEHGLGVVSELEAKLQAIRDQVGFKGDRAAFNNMLREDPRFFVSSPEQLELRYRAILGRVEPKLPRYFSHLPRARYELRRASPVAEAGMSFGYYQEPTPADPVGSYNYNGSNLAARSLVTASHMIYRELVPGVHILLALQAENTQVHPVRKLLYQGAFTNGWAEYAAELAQEMGALDDPYDRYGHLLSQSFVATRLVVDTGMNYLGWPLERARQYMRDHTFESDTIIATETLRYSTDLFGQALDYRLGYEKMLEARHHAESELGSRFDLRQFHDVLIGSGSFPLDAALEHVDDYLVRQGTSDAH